MAIPRNLRSPSNDLPVSISGIKTAIAMQFQIGALAMGIACFLIEGACTKDGGWRSQAKAHATAAKFA
ncbi:MAG: hypothetical protein AAFY26_09470 [Cyanobacteria bacterium J06638_22]